MTLKAARSIASDLGMTIKPSGVQGEYKVTFKACTQKPSCQCLAARTTGECVSCFTDDLTDAVNTAKAMRAGYQS